MVIGMVFGVLLLELFSQIAEVQLGFVTLGFPLFAQNDRCSRQLEEEARAELSFTYRSHCLKDVDVLP